MGKCYLKFETWNVKENGKNGEDWLLRRINKRKKILTLLLWKKDVHVALGEKCGGFEGSKYLEAVAL